MMMRHNVDHLDHIVLLRASRVQVTDLLHR